MRYGWSALVFVVLLQGWGQTAPQGADPGTHSWTDAALHLTFTYPADLSPMDPANLPSALANSAYGEDPDAGSSSLLTGPCAKTLLAVGKGSAGPGGPGKVWGNIVVVSVEGSCIPPKALRNKGLMDRLLTGVVTRATEILGMEPGMAGAGSLIDGHRVEFAESQGQPVTKSDLQPAESRQMLAVFAVQIGDRIVSWKFESNNPALFNHMLGSHLDTGTGPPKMLLPGTPPAH